MLRVRLATEPDGSISIESPYDPTLVELIKAAIPWDGRTWNKERKRWLVSALYIDDLLEQLSGYDILDARVGAHSGIVADQYATMPPDLKEAFATLYLAPAAPLCVAEGSYRALSRVFHPDMEHGSHDIMGRINHAIAIIRQYLGTEEA